MQDIISLNLVNASLLFSINTPTHIITHRSRSATQTSGLYIDVFTLSSPRTVVELIMLIRHICEESLGLRSLCSVHCIFRPEVVAISTQIWEILFCTESYPVIKNAPFYTFKLGITCELHPGSQACPVIVAKNIFRWATEETEKLFKQQQQHTNSLFPLCLFTCVTARSDRDVSLKCWDLVCLHKHAIFLHFSFPYGFTAFVRRVFSFLQPPERLLSCFWWAHCHSQKWEEICVSVSTNHKTAAMSLVHGRWQPLWLLNVEPGKSPSIFRWISNFYATLNKVPIIKMFAGLV